jgi:EAL domain-containing protein (putative c-di-GMP-specific phosphodiesterase class I)
VINHVFEDLRILKNLLGEDMEISLNISSAELNSESFSTNVSALETKHHVQTRNIIFEITETFAPHQEQNALDWLQELREPGYRIAIDDFGTGYTSLMQMVEYPVDIIKFDRQLVERIAKPHKKALAKSLIDLCHLQGLEVVAEGVETQEQFELLQDINCDYQQGFLISKPMPLSELDSWLCENKLRPVNNSAS